MIDYDEASDFFLLDCTGRGNDAERGREGGREGTSRRDDAEPLG